MSIDTDTLVRVIRDHKDILLQSNDTQFIQISDVQLERYRHNFFGLIRELGLPRMFNQAYLIVNGLDEYTQAFTNGFIVAPSETQMLDLVNKS
jgi:hypothetical protein